MTRFPTNHALFVHSFITEWPLPPPKHNGDFWRHDLLGTIRRVIDKPCPPFNCPSFVFEPTTAATTANLRFLEKHGMDLSAAIKAQAGSPVSYGSEFRPTSTLEQVFGLHPNWPRMKKLLENGSDWPLDKVSMSDREADLDEALAFGNHKGAESNPELLRKLVVKDITHGYALPIPLSAITKLPGAILAPMNINGKTPSTPRGRSSTRTALHTTRATSGHGENQ